MCAAGSSGRQAEVIFEFVCTIGLEAARAAYGNDGGHGDSFVIELHRRLVST
jgi:hypothetical protein